MYGIVWSLDESYALLMIASWSPRGSDVASSQVQAPTSKTHHYLTLASLFVPSFPDKETQLENIIDDAVKIQEKSVTHKASTETQSSSQTYVGQGKDQRRGVLCSVVCF